MSAHFERALVLYEQSRYALAERELRQALADEPNKPMAHTMLAMCLSEMERYDEATTAARTAIHLAPDLAVAHYALASVLNDRNHLDDAEHAICESLRLDPESVNSYATLAEILLKRRRWGAALVNANLGLQINAEDVACNNLRAMALVKLGRKREAGATIDAALARDPDNAVTHANMGWTLLEKNDPAKALEHFREALRLDPDSEWARLGIIEALKARHLIYRLMLKYFLWTSKLSRRMQWGVIIGAYVLFRLLRSWAKTNPDVAPYIWPLLGCYFGFAFLSWTAVPLFNLLLRLNRFGRLALSSEQIRASNWIGGCLLFVIIAAVSGLLLGQAALLLAALMAVFWILPLAGTFNCEPGWPRNAMAAYTLALALLGGTAVAAFLLWSLDVFVTFFGLFFLGVLLSSFVANALAMAQVRR